MGDNLHHNGAFFLSQNFGFFYYFAQRLEDPLHENFKPFNFTTPDGYEFFLGMGPLANSDKVLLKGRSPEWVEFLEHPNYDAFWKARNTRPHLKNVHCAVMTVGGWHDAEDLFGSLETYRWTERQNPGITNILVMGPWAHGNWGRQDGDALGDISFHAKTAEFYREKIELPFFRHFLKGDTNYTAIEAQVFETGDRPVAAFRRVASQAGRGAHTLFARGRLPRFQPAHRRYRGIRRVCERPCQTGSH